MAESKLLGFSVEQILQLGLPKENQDLLALKQMAENVVAWDVIPRGEATFRKSQTGGEVLQSAEVNLDAEWQRQAQNFIKLGFHTERKLSEEDYLASLPKFEPQPENYKDRFSLPLLVETSIPWERQAELAGIDVSEYLRQNAGRVSPIDSRSKSPEAAYSGWFSGWNERFPEKIKPSDSIKQLRNDEVGGGIYEGISMQIAHPEFNREGKYFDLIGDGVEPGIVLYLRCWGPRPELDATWNGLAFDNFRPLVRGSEIGTL